MNFKKLFSARNDLNIHSTAKMLIPFTILSDNNINLHELGISVHAVTGALKNFFNLLPAPLIPYEFGKKINTIMSKSLVILFC